MVSINGSSSPLLPNGRDTGAKSTKPNGTSPTDNINPSSVESASSASSAQGPASVSPSQQGQFSSRTAAPAGAVPNAVANAVALSVKAQKSADFQQNQVQYDAPEGKARRALQEYFSVMSQGKRDELAQMLGVDMYV